MSLSFYTIALISIAILGYIAGVGLGTMAYFANEKNY